MKKNDNFLENRNIVIVDIETTGLFCDEKEQNSAEISRIDATKLENGKITETFSTYVACDKKIDDNIAILTGINNDTLKNAPSCETALKNFVDFSNGCSLYARNEVFVNKFLSFYTDKLGIRLDLCCEENDCINNVLNFYYIKGLLRLYNISDEENETIQLANLLIKLQDEPIL